MKKVIKVVVIVIFLAVITKQVVGLSNNPSIDYDKYIQSIEKLEFNLAAAGYSEAKLLIMSDIEDDPQFDPNENNFKPSKDKVKANKTIARLISEYEGLQHNPKLRQKSVEEVAVLNYRMDNHDVASIKAKEVLGEYPRSLPASTVLAMCQHEKAFQALKDQDYDAAIAAYEEIQEYPVASGAEALSNYFIGKMYERKLDSKQALVYYTNIVDECAELGWVERAQKRIDKINDKK
ncbi:MAG: hypothetical protein KJ915_10410 [Candidatus Omnitrophica bacterium]|nr:hypothetical protein [Candidatus Omnitrophota bacterium]